MFDTLLVDIGNSRTKWRAVALRAGFQDGDLQGTVPHTAHASLREVWHGLGFERAWIVNVAGTTVLGKVRDALKAAQPQCPVALFRTQAAECGVRNGYRLPDTLGADRWAGLVAARGLYPEQNVLVTSLGTATTIDLLRADGCFVGGMILPGLWLMRQSLARHTADLPMAEGVYQSLAQDTDTAIVSGAIHAQAGAIERAVRHSGLLPRDPCSPDASPSDSLVCSLTGGDARLIAPRLPFFCAITDNLVLRGLWEVARRKALSETSLEAPTRARP